MHIPPGFTTVFPYIFARDAHAYMDFLRDGLGGEVSGIHDNPDGSLANGQIRFNDTTVMVSEATGDNPASQATYYIYVADADAAMAKAVAAGKREIYVRYTDHGMAGSKLVIPAGKTGTGRNMNTVAKLAEMAAALD